MAQVALAHPQAAGHDHHDGKGPVGPGHEQLAVDQEWLAATGIIYGLVVVDGVGARNLDVPADHACEGDRTVPEPLHTIHRSDPRYRPSLRWRRAADTCLSHPAATMEAPIQRT